MRGDFLKEYSLTYELFGKWGMVLTKKSTHNGIVGFKIAVIKV